MNEKSIIIIEVLVLLGAALGFIYICAIIAGSRRARREFRVKGYVRPPAGRAWLRFLLIRQYEAFDDPMIRFFFRIAHGCLIAMMIGVGAILILTTCEIILGLVASGPAAFR